MPTPEKRENRDGTTTWFVRIRDPRRISAKTGKPMQTSEPFDTEPEALRFCRAIEVLGVTRALAELELEAGDPDEPTLDEWAARHFKAITGITDGTRVSYERIYKRTWSTPLGGRRLSTITNEDIGAAVNALTGSDKTIKNAWGVLAGMFKAATRPGSAGPGKRLIDDNPCVGVRLPRRTEHEKVEHRYLSVEEFKQLLDATPEYWRPLVLMLAGTGMRWGELEALTVADVVRWDARLKAPVVRIFKGVKWDPSKAIREVGPAKTRRSKRDVTLPVEVFAAIEPLLDRPGPARLFVPPRSEQLRHKTFYTDIWAKKSAAAVPAPRPRIHDLRHTHVAWLIAAGVPLPVIQQRLGHEKITTTIDTYGHLLPDLQTAASDAWSTALNQRLEAAERRGLPGPPDRPSDEG